MSTNKPFEIMKEDQKGERGREAGNDVYIQPIQSMV